MKNINKKSPNKTCRVLVDLHKDTGDFTWSPVKGYEGDCEKTMKTLNPVRGIFWKKRKKQV